MDNGLDFLDSLVDELAPDAAAAPPEAPASAPSASESEAQVDVQPEVAVVEAPLPIVEAAPVPDYASEIEAMKARLAQAEEKGALLDQLRAAAEEKQRQAAEAERFAAWQSRMDELEELPKAQREAEKQRILTEVQAYRNDQYQAQVAQQESVAEEAAKAFAAIYSVLPNYLSADQLAAAQADAKHLLQLQSPDAMKAQIARDKALEARGYERAKAEIAKAQEAVLAKQAQERIASGADLVGAGVGAPAAGSDDDWTPQKFLDDLFG